ncbi:MAG: MBL fold metallo-hydrolase [Candidatus Bipolaricaulaceae bacterium]
MPPLVRRVESAGLAHFSYLVGDQYQAVVIDPRRDCDVYLQLADERGMRITHVLETHRNEDYVSGSLELAARTGAEVFRPADEELDYRYGRPFADGQRLQVGRLSLQGLHTPGHTMGHLSYLLHDPQGVPWMVFTGDSLLAGAVGRTDLYGPQKLEHMTGLLYDSLVRRLLPLGDQMLVCPAHGAGSACGNSISERTWTTMGLERNHNPHLQHGSRAEFVEQVARSFGRPPYFRKMEEMNLGPPVLGGLPHPLPLTPSEFAARAQRSQVLDVRMELSFGSAHVPGALSIWETGLPRFAGWFLSYDRPILLVSETYDVSQSVRHLIRMGFDRVEGYLAGGMLAWHTEGLDSTRVQSARVHDLCRKLDAGEDIWILDVRSPEEVERTAIPIAHPIPLTGLRERRDEVPRDRPVYIFCGSGLRAMVGASLLQQAGWENLTVVLGGLAS